MVLMQNQVNISSVLGVDCHSIFKLQLRVAIHYTHLKKKEIFMMHKNVQE